MAELTVSQLIKIIIGVLVVVAVIWGVSILFKDRVIDFFKGLKEVGNFTKLILPLI